MYIEWTNPHNQPISNSDVYLVHGVLKHKVIIIIRSSFLHILNTEIIGTMPIGQHRGSHYVLMETYKKIGDPTMYFNQKNIVNFQGKIKRIRRNSKDLQTILLSKLKLCDFDIHFV